MYSPNLFSVFCSPKLEIIVPQRGDSVLHPPIGFNAVYVDHFKAGLHLSLFPLLLNILDHYHLALSQLISNAIQKVVVFQIFCDSQKIRSSIDLFRRFLLLNLADFLGWYAFSFRRPYLKMKMASKNADWKDKVFFFKHPSASQVHC